MDGRRQFRKVGLLEGNVKCHDSSNEAKTENHFIKDYIWVWPNRVGCTLSSRSICNFYCCTSCYMILTLLFWLFLCVLTLRKRWCPFLRVFFMLCSSPGAPPPPPSGAPSASGVSFGHENTKKNVKRVNQMKSRHVWWTEMQHIA